MEGPKNAKFRNLPSGPIGFSGNAPRPCELGHDALAAGIEACKDIDKRRVNVLCDHIFR
jgi:hypothetical protein